VAAVAQASSIVIAAATIADIAIAVIVLAALIQD
jgi:hypothetical protein